jgi:hypothetical protein
VLGEWKRSSVSGASREPSLTGNGRGDEWRQVRRRKRPSGRRTLPRKVYRIYGVHKTQRSLQEREIALRACGAGPVNNHLQSQGAQSCSATVGHFYRLKV